MQRTSLILLTAVCALAVGSCNQPFEPDGPVSNKLVVYSILNVSSVTQYIRVGTTYQNPPGPVIRNASVVLRYSGGTIVFRDTTIYTLDPSGLAAPMNLYIAPQLQVFPGTTYTLQVTTPEGLTATAQTTTLIPPTMSMVNPRTLDSTTGTPPTLNVLFRSFSGAAVLHFFVDYYAYVDGGWELHRAEVPLSSYVDNNGSLIRVFPSLALVKSFTVSQKTMQMKFDIGQYGLIRNEVSAKYPVAPVIWLQAVFEIIQVDDALFNYYYVYNGPVDKSSIRLDQPDYTNVPNGLGVFGNSVTTTATYPIRH